MVELRQAEARGAASTVPPRVHERHAGRSPDRLLRDAWMIRSLLDDLAADDHAVRTKLLVARDEVRLEAARQWHAHGWRPITDEF